MPLFNADGQEIASTDIAAIRGRAANRVPAGLAQEVASTRDGRDIFRPFTRGLQEDANPLLSSAADWGVYDTIFRDDQVKSCWQQRTGALISRDWEVVAGGDQDIDKLAADAMRENIGEISWDRISEKMIKARFNGYSTAEIGWVIKDGLYWFGSRDPERLRPIHVRNARRFRKDDQDRLRLLTTGNMQGELVPPRKIWLMTSGGDDDDQPYGLGLAHWLYWPVTFKRNGLKFWNTFLDKYGAPTAIGKYRPGTSQGDIDKLLNALQAIATDTGIAVPDGMLIELLEASRSAGADYDKMVQLMDNAIAKVLLSQAGTTENGAWSGTADTHADVRDDVVKADADLITESFAAGPGLWWTELNFPGAAVPRVIRKGIEEDSWPDRGDRHQDEAVGLGKVRREHRRHLWRRLGPHRPAGQGKRGR